MRRIPAETEAAVVAAYRLDMPVDTIAAHCRVALSTVYAILRRHQIAIGRPQGGSRFPEWTQTQLDGIGQLRRAGATVAEIQAAIGAGYKRVRQALESLDLLHLPAPAEATAREVVEKALGRTLASDERVWHRNGDTSDNTLTNLVVKRKT
jgi:hypothetical protein